MVACVARAGWNGPTVTTPEDSPTPRLRGSVPPWILPPAGEPHGRVCAFCGEEAPPDSAFCPNDGRALTASLHATSGTTLTVLFTDIEDSVYLTERLGDAGWAEIADDHDTIVRDAIERFAGFEVKGTGDGFLIVFADASQAARAAIEIQRRIAARAAARPDWPVRVRIGLHRGDVLLRPGGDILGRTVNMAQRVMDKSEGGEIWLSASVYEEVRRDFAPQDIIDRGPRRLRGMEGRQQLYELVWSATEDQPPLGSRAGRLV
jgi:class 3 adenylate cyclase